MERPTLPLVGDIIDHTNFKKLQFFSTADSDYETTTLMLTFEPSGDGQTVCGNVPIIDDNLGLEPNELFSVRITSASGANVMIGDDESFVEIIDNDGTSCIIHINILSTCYDTYSITCAVPEIKWEEERVTIPEGDDRTVCFTSDIGTAAAYSVVVAASPKLDNRSATEGMRVNINLHMQSNSVVMKLKSLKSHCSGVDYTVESTLSFNVPVMASGGRYCIDLSTVDDNIAEGTEQFQLTFDSITPAGSATEGDPAVLCVDVGDNRGKILLIQQ